MKLWHLESISNSAIRAEESYWRIGVKEKEIKNKKMSKVRKNNFKLNKKEDA